jgi:hypothetical protein
MAVLIAVNGFNLEKTVNSKYKGVIYEYKNKKKFGLALKFLWFCVVLRLRRKIVCPPIMAQSKYFVYKTLIFNHI